MTNLVKMPKLNPIEMVFSQLKQKYKTLKLRHVVNNINHRPMGLVAEAIDLLHSDAVKNTCQEGHNRWKHRLLSNILMKS